MKHRVFLPGESHALARAQAGALSTDQLHRLGVSRDVVKRLRAEGTLLPLAHGVYALWPGDWLQSAWGAVLAGGDHAVLGNLAAAYQHRLVPEPPGVIDCYCPNRSSRREGRWRFIRAARTGSGAPPVTGLAQTVVDAARVLDADEVVALVARARRHGALREIPRLLDDVGRHPRRAELMEALGEVGRGAQSPLEVRYVRDVERRHGLPASR